MYTLIFTRRAEADEIRLGPRNPRVPIVMSLLLRGTYPLCEMMRV
jgi:hypothetical protein